MSLKRCKQNLVHLLLVILACWQNAFAALEDLPLGARSLAMGASYVALANTADALFLNPAGLSQLTGTELSLFYQRPFGLPDLNFGMVAGSFPLRSHRLGIGFLHFGNSLYKEQMFAASYSRSYQQKLFWGLGLRYQTVQIDGYGSTGTFGLDFGFLVPVHRQLRLGFMAKNLNRPAIGTNTDRLPQTFNMGASLQPVPKLILSMEIFKDVRFSEEVRFGAEILPLPLLALRFGAASNPDRFSAGFGLTAKKLAVDYAFFTHSDLGLTHQMSLSFRFGRAPASSQTQRRGESIPQSAEIETKAQTSSEQKVAEKLDINVASVAELTTLPGIGRSLAQAIVDYRRVNGPFVTIELIQKVPGVGEKKFEQIKERISVN